MLDGRAELNRPGPDQVMVAGVAVRRGSRVVLHPRSTDDILIRALDGRRAIIDAIEHDLEDQVHIAVSLEDDPARGLGKGRQLGHRFFFAPGELEPLPDSGPGAPPRRVLIAGIGNVFLGDDGFGVAVAAALTGHELPDGVDVVDFGIRGMDLAYALADGYDAAVLIDATPRGQTPGTLELIEPDLDLDIPAELHAHGMHPLAVLRLASRFGALPPRTLIVGCEPQDVVDQDAGEVAVELSAAVRRAVEPAVELVLATVEELLREPDPIRSEGGMKR